MLDVLVLLSIGLVMPKLLELNKADYEDLVVPGQRIKVC